MRISLTLLFLAALGACRPQPVDEDGDGVPLPLDCNDADAAVSPEATEVCNGIDDDCDGEVDTAAEDATDWYADADGDGSGDLQVVQHACDAPEGFVASADDCDDSDAAFHPGASEDDCTDPADYNCDGSVGYADADADGWAACEDCDDLVAEVHPQAPETCDGVDNDCDAVVDNNPIDAPTLYADSDGDGFGDDAETRTDACTAPEGWVNIAGDCAPTEASAYPGGTEVCDGLDNDCNSAVDEDTAVDAPTWYADGDQDGFGDAATNARACAQPTGYVSDASDCDDTKALVSPSADELCSTAYDDDCDGQVNDATAVDALTWYLDEDLDGFGRADTTQLACLAPANYAAVGTDCGDLDPTIYPGADEYCDTVDSDCDGDVNDPNALDAVTWYLDADGDGFGDPNQAVTACDVPQGYVADATDCDDTDIAINTTATEVCDGVDNDCDSAIDEAGSVGETRWYVDADGDGDGAATDPGELACDAPLGRVATNTDCNDADPSTQQCVCSDGILDPGEEIATDPHYNLAPAGTGCRWDFSRVRQLYCNGGCTWAGGSGCDQADADILCKLITDNPLSTALSWTDTTALPEGGFSCPYLGTPITVDRGVGSPVRFQDTSILADHGAGRVVADPVCTNP